MSKKLLYISNIASKRMNGSFNGTAIAAAHNLGFEVISVANRSKSSETDIKADEEKWGIKLLHIDLARSTFKFFQNYKAYKQLVKIIKENNIDYIHCNTPIGGILGRFAGRTCGVKKIIYQAHGFHFCKGAPLKNWFFYYPVERFLAHLTDTLITINKEDFELAKKLPLKNKKSVYYVHGVGIDSEKYFPLKDNKYKRNELGLNDGDIALVSVGEYAEYKNHLTIIKAMMNLPDNYILFLCGEGPMRSQYERYIKNNKLQGRVKLLGYRSDIHEILCACDVFVFPSTMEGLPRAIMEAMATKCPVVCSKIRGHVDLIKSNECLFSPHSIEEYIRALHFALDNSEKIVGINSGTLKDYCVDNVTSELRKIYKKELIDQLEDR